MTTRKRNTKLLAVEAVAGDRDLMKALMKEALQEVLEGEMTEFLGAAPGERTEGRNGYRSGYYGRIRASAAHSRPMLPSSLSCLGAFLKKNRKKTGFFAQAPYNARL